MFLQLEFFRRLDSLPGLLVLIASFVQVIEMAFGVFASFSRDLGRFLVDFWLEGATLELPVFLLNSELFLLLLRHLPKYSQCAASDAKSGQLAVSSWKLLCQMLLLGSCCVTLAF